MIELFLRGGLTFMLPLLLASIFVVALLTERWLRFRAAEVDYEGFLDEIRQLLQKRGVRAARKWAEDIPGPVARLWSEGLGASRYPLPIVRERMESAAIHEIDRLERLVPSLSLVAQVAPLVGILGTVWGMIIAFQGMEGGLALGVGVQGEQLAGGIWKALVTTAAGLVVSIPALLAHHYLSGRVERFIRDMELSITDLGLFLSAARSSSPAPSASTTEQVEEPSEPVSALGAE